MQHFKAKITYMKKGLELLLRLPDAVKQNIINKYGSLEKYYDFVFNLYKSDYQISQNKSTDSRIQRQKIQTLLYDLEDELEIFGLEDGLMVLSEISADHSETVLIKFLHKLN
jgi:hypothetical protein